MKSDKALGSTENEYRFPMVTEEKYCKRQNNEERKQREGEKQEWERK